MLESRWLAFHWWPLMAPQQIPPAMLTPNNAPSHTDPDRLPLIDRVRVWADELSSAEQSISQIDRLGMVFLIGFLVVLGCSLALAAHLDKISTVNPIWAYMLAVLSIGFLFLLRLRADLGRHIVGLVLVMAVGAQIGAVWSNGFAPMLLLPALISTTHILSRPNPALAISALSMAVIFLIAELRYPELRSVYTVRVFAGSVLCIGLWQLISRSWRSWAARARSVGQRMTDALLEMDATHQKVVQNLSERSIKDAGSGLPNREGLLAAIARGQPSSSHENGGCEPTAGVDQLSAGVMVAIHIPNWKTATSHLETAAQAKLLYALVQRLRQVVGDEAILARTGPDSFLAWFWAPLAQQGEMILRLTARARNLDTTLVVAGANISIDPMIGLSCTPSDAQDVQTLIRFAETACMAAMQFDGHHPMRFDRTLLLQASERDAIMLEMKEALRNDEFELHYQPVVSMTSGQLTKAEALIRWRHRRRGVIYPSAFIEIAEQSDLIVELTDWTLREASSQVRIWRKTLHPDFQISVNVSPQYLSRCSDRPEEMLARIESLEAPAGALVFEITEGMMLNVTKSLIDFLDRLRVMGFLIAMDDFGLGYSNFGQLEKLKLDFLKLDRSFIEGLDERPNRRSICTAIVAMSHELGFQVVAEGIETDSQRRLMAERGTDFLQGYAFSAALPAADLERWVGAQRAA
jgi:EAL domain-containing protein (putative c-di-GMP-specific phosphodiesterase class I)/GGDEF domain-containing protein